MAHDNNFLDGITFGNDGTTINIPFHDNEALHDEDGAVKASNIAAGAISEEKLADGAITMDKIADGAITLDKFNPELKEAWDSQSQPLKFEAVDLSYSNIAVGGYGHVNKSVPLSGYTLVGVVGYVDASSSAKLVPCRLRVTGTYIDTEVRNIGDAAVSDTITYTLMYVRNEVI